MPESEFNNAKNSAFSAKVPKEPVLEIEERRRTRRFIPGKGEIVARFLP